jgi:hypothetical protein
MGKCTRITFNSNEYSVAHPALSVDEKTLYFASDRYEGLIRSFKVSINQMILIHARESRIVLIESRETFRISHQIIRCILPVMDILDLEV